MVHPSRSSTRLILILFAVVLPFLVHGRTESNSLKEEIENYFAQTKQVFDRLARSNSVRQTKLSVTDRYFIQTLKKHSTFNTLIRTNSKGVIISEVIRSEKPEREFRDVSKQKWYKICKKTLDEYTGFVKDKGRYYLFWSQPVLKGNRRFVGAVVAKIDLWDSFYKFSMTKDESFLIRFRGRTLYKNNWKRIKTWKEANLTIPGIEKVSIRYVPGEYEEFTLGMGGVKQDPVVSVSDEKKSIEKSEKQTVEKSDAAQGGSNRLVLVISIVAFIVILILCIRLFIQFKHWRLMRKVDKSDVL